MSTRESDLRSIRRPTARDAVDVEATSPSGTDGGGSTDGSVPGPSDPPLPGVPGTGFGGTGGGIVGGGNGEEGIPLGDDILDIPTIALNGAGGVEFDAAKKKLREDLKPTDQGQIPPGGFPDPDELAADDGGFAGAGRTLDELTALARGERESLSGPARRTALAGGAGLAFLLLGGVS